MKIGQLAKRAGVTADTIRYYEKEGLLNRPLRQSNGYRLYRDTDLIRVQFICTAKKVGFSLLEIRQLLPEIEQGTLSRKDVEDRLHAKLYQVDEKIKELQQLKVDITFIFTQLKCGPESPLSFAKLVN